MTFYVTFFDRSLLTSTSSSKANTKIKKHIWVHYSLFSLGFVKLQSTRVCMEMSVSVCVVLSDSDHDSPVETHMHCVLQTSQVTHYLTDGIEKPQTKTNTHTQTQDNPSLPNIHTLPKPRSPSCPWLPCKMNCYLTHTHLQKETLKQRLLNSRSLCPQITCGNLEICQFLLKWLFKKDILVMTNSGPLHRLTSLILLKVRNS